jgi:Ice-binding-like
MHITGGTNKRGARRLAVLLVSLGLAIAVALSGPTGVSFAAPLQDTTPDLGTVNSFAVFADTLISSAGNASVINGDVGLEDGTGAAIGVQCGEVGTFSIFDRDNAYTGAGGGSTACFSQNAGLLGTADTDLIAAYDRLAASDNAGCDRNIPAVDDLSLLSPLGPGVYCATAFIITGDLTLSGSGIWIFRSASTIDTDPDVTVSGGDACSVWWRAESSVTIGTGNTVVGNFLALDSISDDGSSTVNGRLLARNGAVTLNTTTINRGPLCASITDQEEEEEDEEEEAVSGLPDTGGAPIRNEGFPWSLVIVGGLSAAALAFGVRAYRRTQLPKQ